MQTRSQTKSQSDSQDEVISNVQSQEKQQKEEKLIHDDDPAAAEALYPKDVPSLIEIKKVLGKEVFQSDLSKSMFFVLKDFCIISGLYLVLLATELEPFGTQMFKYLYLPFYWFLQGTMFWSLFVLGHDCGHGSFSKYWYVNDFMGNILHSVILVPFYPWKLSHKHHHKNTGNIDKDEIFYPMRESEFKKMRDGNNFEFLPYFWLGFSWFYYLVYGYGAGDRTVKHFNPFDGVFNNHALNCTISLGCWLAWACMCFYYGTVFGFLTLAVHYLIPVMVFASWLVVVTFLHHQDVGVQWYSNEKWDFVRGNLSSVDRDYGPFHELTHNIGTHQIHHLFIMIPHYNLEEATSIFRKHYPHLIKKSEQSIIPSFIKMFKIFSSQFVISNEKTIFAYKELKAE